MKIHYFSGDICLESPLHIGSGERGEYIDCLVQKDGDGKPIIPGASICGLMATIARDCLRLAGASIDKLEDEPVFQSLLGSARETKRGQESRLVVLDAALKDSEATTFVQDRTSISRERGSAMEDHLFSDELIPKGAQFKFRCEFREKVSVAYGEGNTVDSAVDIHAEALKLLKDILELMSGGWYTLGGKGGTGRGLFGIENLGCFTFDRTNPDDVLTFTVDGCDALKEKNRVPFNPLKDGKVYASCKREDTHPSNTPEILVIEGTLTPLEPILIKAGYSNETFTPEGHRSTSLETLSGLAKLSPKETSVDAAFCRDHCLQPYVPGSSIRGSLRAHGERMVRSMLFGKCKDEKVNDEAAEFKSNNAAWDVFTAKKMGNKFAREKVSHFDSIINRACIISRLFGFTALGGTVSFFDAFPTSPEEFKKGLKLLDHVAIDRFTGGAAKGRKFNAMPFFPSYPNGVFPGDNAFHDKKGDMRFKVVLRDFEKWHLGLLFLLINDLYLGRIRLGYGTNNGFGRVKLMADSITLTGLTGNDGILGKLVCDPKDEKGGFLSVSKTIKSCENFWVSKEEPFYHVAEEAVQEFRTELINWKNTPEPVGGST